MTPEKSEEMDANLISICGTQIGTPAHGANSRLDCERQIPMLRRQSFLTMRFNIWVILAALLALLVAVLMTRAPRYAGGNKEIT